MVKCSNKGGDTAQNSKRFEKKRGGTLHISIKVIWSDVHTRVGTAHKVLEQNVKLYPRWMGGRVVAGT